MGFATPAVLHGEPWTFAGKVLDADVQQAGAGKAGVEVMLCANSDLGAPALKTTLTNAEGKFVLQYDVSTPSLTVRYKKTGHQIMLPAITVTSAGQAGTLPDALCRKSGSSKGLTAFREQEILAALADHQKGLTSAEARSRTTSDLDTLRKEGLDPDLLKKVEQQVPR